MYFIVVIFIIVIIAIFILPNYRKSEFRFIPDQYRSLLEVEHALRKAGLESSNLIIGIDYTKSNLYTGMETFGAPMHSISADKKNPYQQVIQVIGETLSAFDDDNLIPAFGFGDVTTTDKKVFPFYADKSCYGISEVLSRYNELTPNIVLSGPTSFGPIIRTAIEIVRNSQAYHILLIIADGQVTNERDTINAIVEASNYPLSIVMVGVGDGPWHMMKEFDDRLPERKFDNFQFVNFHEVMSQTNNNEAAFALAALQEIPEQYKTIKALHLI